ncbi:OsmC family protein [Bacillus paralicheniformis]|uniref:OsmC family protein n=1 Tax=Bacillus paralicheniformis TaxID=1648923 RepID=UPI0007414A27|nr:OsmC family protein [Bacillus paralicheniformis]KUL15219.1 peroxiredoxin [Bacillus licheniformis LMG 6934]MBG9884113.1 hypothetical protein [Bacillus paralicheniformis]MDE1385556.1 OsmC family protein [Bacillus paralicheniformis]MDE1390136.1 OsmC family protein [Bacillus paralicheniformis]MED0807163.1 OsmC family protein [Bacillus paralicheniformis]
MSIIRKTNGEFGIFHEAGMQAKGSFTPNSDGLSPIELLEASLGMCITISLQRMFERDGIEVQEDEFSVSVSAAKAPDGPSRVEKCTVSIKLPEHLPTDYKNKLITSAERACTIGNTLKRGVTIDTNMV